ncbi:MAG: AbrB/MazE/SpoVT family DNA-binding domain-containing protein, partial [Bacilli bacterium]|nr:AbrB/MazE/SpoVT family DNA-binding domain-containing protein [Bacilli bacterium]
VKQLYLKEGDSFEVKIENGCILLQPVAIYSKEYIAKLANEIKALRKRSDNDKESFVNIDDLINNLK